MNQYLNVFILIIYIVFILLSITTFLFNSMEYKSSYKKKKVLAMPEFKSPGYLSFLMYKKIKKSVLIVQVMGLINNQTITIDKEGEDVLLIYSNKRKKQSKSNQILLDILFKDIGNEKTVKLSDIDNYSKSGDNCSEFLTNYSLFKRLVLYEVSDNNYYEEKRFFRLLKTFEKMAIILFFANLAFQNFTYLVLLMPFLPYILLLFFYNTYRRKEKANDEYYKWLNYKKTLKETKEKGYLAPAIVLGISEEYFSNTKQIDTPKHIIYKSLSNLVLKSSLYGKRSIYVRKNIWPRI